MCRHSFVANRSSGLSISRLVIRALIVLACAVPARLVANEAAKMEMLDSECHAGKQKACRELVKVAVEDKDAEVRNVALTKLLGYSDAEVVRLLLESKPDAASIRDDAGRTPLYLAASDGRKEVADVLLASHADVNARANDGSTPLYAAVDNGHKEVVELLLLQGAKVDDKAGNGDTPLLRAIRSYGVQSNADDIVALLLNHGADANGADKDGVTPLELASSENMKDSLRQHGGREPGKELFAAIQNGEVANVRALLIERPNLVSRRGDLGVTPLHIAAALGNIDIMQLLLASHADVNARDGNSKTPLRYAADYDQVEAVKLLLANHADIDAQDGAHDTALGWAAEFGHKKMAELLLENGAPYNISIVAAAGDLNRVQALAKDHPELISSKDGFGMTPLHWAAGYASEEVAEFLLAQKADMNAKDRNGMTPLHYAAGYTPARPVEVSGRKETMALLLAHGADVNARDNDGDTPLHIASAFGHADLVTLLLANHADVNAKDRGNGTPLNYAAANQHRDVVEILAANAAEYTFADAVALGDTEKVKTFLEKDPSLVSSKNGRGVTPLHTAAGNGQIEMVKLFLAHGADVNAKISNVPTGFGAQVVTDMEMNGATPLHWAAFANHRDVVELLLKSGADVNAKINDAWTPLDVAQMNDHQDIVDLLRQYGGQR